MRPHPDFYPPYFKSYFKLIAGDDIKKIIRDISPRQLKSFECISEEQSLYKYADEKWTVKEILQHVIDSERVFCYRALALARGESQALPGFDENDYAKNAHANIRPWSDLVSEFGSVRNASVQLIESLNEEDMQKLGTVNDYKISVGAILFVIPGHVQHHLHIIRERYFELDCL